MSMLSAHSADLSASCATDKAAGFLLRKVLQSTATLGLCAFLSACPSGGDGGDPAPESVCQSIGGGGAQAAVSNCTNCTVNAASAAVDRNFSSTADITISASATGSGGVHGTAQNGIVFSSGDTGAYVTLPSLSGSAGSYTVTIQTYLDDVLQESSVAYAVSGTSNFCNICQLNGSGQGFIGINTNTMFDAIEVLVSHSRGVSDSTTRIHELCTK